MFYDDMKIQPIGASRSLVCLLATQKCLVVTNASAAGSTKQQVKALMPRCNQFDMTA